MNKKDIDNSLKWNKRIGFRLIMELLTMIGPFLCVIFISWLVYYLVSGSNKSNMEKPSYTHPFVCERFFSSSKIMPVNYYPFLNARFTWGLLRVRMPEYWINFTDKRYGGQTLTIQPAESSMFGMHIQVSTDENDNEGLEKVGREFIRKIKFRNADEYKMQILRRPAYCFDVFYLASGRIPMKSQFIFLRKGNSIIHIIIYAPSYIFDHRLSLFHAIIDSIEFNPAME